MRRSVSAIDSLVNIYLEIDSVCRQDQTDSRVLSAKLKEFNTLYRKATPEQQGEYHARVAAARAGVIGS